MPAMANVRISDTGIEYNTPFKPKKTGKTQDRIDYFLSSKFTSFTYAKKA